MCGLMQKTACAVGLHGPRIFWPKESERSMIVGVLTRECQFCGARWSGEQIYAATRSIKWTRIAASDSAEGGAA